MRIAVGTSGYGYEEWKGSVCYRLPVDPCTR